MARIAPQRLYNVHFWFGTAFRLHLPQINVPIWTLPHILLLGEKYTFVLSSLKTLNNISQQTI